MRDCRVIGVTGAGRGTGATHLSILCANYLASCMQRKVSVIQWNSHGDFQKVEHMLAGNSRQDSALVKYPLFEADYYKTGDPRLLAQCMEDAYDDIIIDFGEMRDAIRGEWLRCSIQVITASLSEWKLEAFLELLSEEEGRRAGWIYTAAFGSEDTRKEIEKQFRISLNRIPLSVDAFSVDRGIMDWFKGILN